MAIKKDRIQVTLPRCEALVLFEWLASLDAGEEKMPLDAAEQQVVWRLEGQLESLLTEIVAADYQERVVAAKQQVLNSDV